MGVQDVIAILLTLLAAGHLVRMAWLRMVRSAPGGCNACGTCEEANPQDTPPLVQIEKKTYPR